MKISSCNTSNRRVTFMMNVFCEYSNFLSSAIREFFKANGIPSDQDPQNADIVVLNSCGFTSFQKRVSEQAIEHALSSYKDKLIVIFGCLPKMNDKYKHLKNVVCIGPKEMEMFNGLVDARSKIEDVDILRVNSDGVVTYQGGLQEKDFYVPISQGCVNNCSYCTIKRAKGMVSSRGIDAILKDIRIALQGGVTEFTLLADDCGSYGMDIGTDLPALIDKICEIDASVKLKLYYLFPSFLVSFFPRLERHFKDSRITYMNIPLQSASDRILRMMNRNYSYAAVIKAIENLRLLDPHVWLMTHVIFCFPSESDEDFLRSLHMSERFDQVFYFLYSQNEGINICPAEEKIDEQECQRRIELVKRHITERRVRGGMLTGDVWYQSKW